MPFGVTATTWYKCVNCGSGVNENRVICAHCGYKHTEAELEYIDKELSTRSRSWTLFALVFFPAVMLIIYNWLSHE
jgi:uncharacterized membrane protein YvbJ